MTNVIEIRNLRNISRLRFEIPKPGVWLLTAGNGAGKTSLLGCLRRIGHPNAFPIHFPSSLQSERLDNHSRGTVTYEIDGEVVEYAYRGERWTPRPRSNSNLFDRLGYPSVLYIGATAERITPRPEDFETRNIRSASQAIISSANDIFETDKFTRLRTINLTRGTGNEVFVLALGTPPYNYHSEKHFSLGELCVLKLLRLLTEVADNSMIIIDELEMALHPRAQVKLLSYLESQSRAKSLTVIFSTHSVTLLKSINRNQIIYLDNQDGAETKVIVGCFPTYVIGNIASGEETFPDIMLYVEDLFARDMLSAFFEKFLNERIPDPTERPTIKIVPVGPFTSVVAFLERNRSVLPQSVWQTAVLDADVSKETIVSWEKSNNYTQLSKFKSRSNDIRYLPFTPEVGLIDYIRANVSAFETKLRGIYNDNQLRIASLLDSYDPNLQGAQSRNAAKKLVNRLIAYLEEKTQNSEDSVREKLCNIFAREAWMLYRVSFMELLGPMIR